MSAYIIRRLLQLPLILWIIATISFFLMRMAPGGPFDLEKKVPPEIERNLKAKYRLDEPLTAQYYYYMKDLLKGDLGPSFKYRNRTVAEIIRQSFPVSLTLGGIALIIASLLGVTAGVIAAVRQNNYVDYTAMAVSLLGVSIPNFVLGPLFILVFVFYLDLLPVAGWGTVYHVVLPSLVLAAPYAAYIARLSRTGMLEVIRKDFIRTARSKGLSERDVILKHALKSAVLPVISFLGPATAGIFSGSMVVEQIFNVPGMGTFFVQGAINRDYTVVLGVGLLYASLLILFNLAVDIAYTFIDPRIELK